MFAQQALQEEHQVVALRRNVPLSGLGCLLRNSCPSDWQCLLLRLCADLSGQGWQHMSSCVPACCLGLNTGCCCPASDLQCD